MSALPKWSGAVRYTKWRKILLFFLVPAPRPPANVVEKSPTIVTNSCAVNFFTHPYPARWVTFRDRHVAYGVSTHAYSVVLPST